MKQFFRHAVVHAHAEFLVLTHAVAFAVSARLHAVSTPLILEHPVVALCVALGFQFIFRIDVLLAGCGRVVLETGNVPGSLSRRHDDDKESMRKGLGWDNLDYLHSCT
eukprot:Filipodium_phascolosomae@DN4924_c0_g1_i1.p1